MSPRSAVTVSIVTKPKDTLFLALPSPPRAFKHYWNARLSKDLSHTSFTI
jgi:hypothetical protein